MNFSDFFFDGNIRVEKIVWIAANLDQPNEELIEFFENTNSEEIQRLLEIEVTEEELIDGGDRRDEKFGTLLSRIARTSKSEGFLLQLSTPIPVDVDDKDQVTTYGFGYIRTSWFYIQSFSDGETIMKIAEDWKQKVQGQEILKIRETAKQKAAEKARIETAKLKQKKKKKG